MQTVSRNPFLPLILSGAAALAACAPASNTEQKAEWFRSVQQGVLIRRLNAETGDSSLLGKWGSRPNMGIGPSKESKVGPRSGRDTLPDVCTPLLAEVENDASVNGDAVRLQFGRCVQEIFRGSLQLMDALAATRLLSTPEPHEWIDRWNTGGAAALADFADSIDTDRAFSLRGAPEDHLRRRYTADDLRDQLKLLDLLESEIAEEARLARVVIRELPKETRESIEELDRYSWILQLAGDQLVVGDFPGSELLDPFGFLAGVPAAGEELSGFASNEEGGQLLEDLEHVGLGDSSRARLQRAELYLQFLRNDQEMESRWSEASRGLNASPSQPDETTPSVQVAFIDTGIDLENYPELNTVVHPLHDLSLLADAGFEFGSYDFADENRSPWMIAYGDLAHGTGTAATFLTQLARLDPGSVATSRYLLQSWKVASIRSMLGGGENPGFTTFDPLHLNSFQRAIAEPLRALSVHSDEPAPADSPSIVSISAAFPLYSALRASGESTLLRRAPWLWVMAAGNDRRELGKPGAGGGTACFGEFPQDLRPSQNILCVGAVIRGIFDDALSSQTNTGARVDLYTYDDVSNLCPEGTSCAAPSITAAAAMLFQKFPGITASQVRDSLIAASEEKWVKREQRQLHLPMNAATSAEDSMVAIRFFDPSTMMDAAFDEAGARYRTSAEATVSRE